MATRRENSWILALLAVGLVPLWQASCVPSDSIGTEGTGGSSATAGTSGTAGDNGTAGTTGLGGTTGDGGTTGQGGSIDPAGRGGTTGQGGSIDPAGRGGTTGQGGSIDPAGRGGTTGQGGSTAGTGGSGNAGGSTAGRGGTTGQAGRGGTTGQAGRGGTTGTAGTTGTGGTTGGACPAGTTAEFGCGPARTMGYMGCSMSVNVATGYGRRMGMRMWPAISAYGGQVVQSWTPSGNGGAWPAFESAKSTYGTPTDIWMQICIFAQQGVTAAEVQTMIRNARSHAPGSRIWISGQPTYNSGHTCTLAGNGGAELTDMRAREAANAADNVFYAGTFLLRANVSPSEVAGDTCHASSAGELALGDQFIAKFGR